MIEEEISQNDIKLENKEVQMEVVEEVIETLAPKSQEIYEIDLYYDAQMSLQVFKDDQKIVMETPDTPAIKNA